MAKKRAIVCPSLEEDCTAAPLRPRTTPCAHRDFRPRDCWCSAVYLRNRTVARQLQELGLLGSWVAPKVRFCGGSILRITRKISMRTTSAETVVDQTVVDQT